MKKKKRYLPMPEIGRAGTERTVTLRNLKGGPMESRGTRRNRTRSDRRRRAIDQDISS